MNRLALVCLTGAVLASAAAAVTGCTPSYARFAVDVGEIPVVYEGGTLGTLVDWEPDPEKARERAKAEGRLLLVLHLSGNFESFEET